MSKEKPCDNASVGIIARDADGRILLVERKKFPFGWAPPAGHLDGLTYPMACFSEFEEETGLKVVGAPRPLNLKHSRKYLRCRRGGRYHDWQIFEVNWRPGEGSNEAGIASGELKPNQEETKNIKWHTLDEVYDLVEKTRIYLSRMMALSNPAIPSGITYTAISMLEKDWEERPGLEEVWCDFFQELKIISGGAP